MRKWQKLLPSPKWSTIIILYFQLWLTLHKKQVYELLESVARRFFRRWQCRSVNICPGAVFQYFVKAMHESKYFLSEGLRALNTYHKKALPWVIGKPTSCALGEYQSNLQHRRHHLFPEKDKNFFYQWPRGVSWEKPNNGSWVRNNSKLFIFSFF